MCITEENYIKKYFTFFLKEWKCWNIFSLISNKSRKITKIDSLKNHKVYPPTFNIFFKDIPKMKVS